VRRDYGNQSHFSARVATGSEGGVLEIMLDSLSGEKAGELIVRNTGGWDAWQTMDTVLAPYQGTREIILRFKGNEPELFSLDWIRFE